MPRKKGTPNKITSEVRGLLFDLVAGQIGNVEASLERMRHEDERMYLRVFVSLLPYVVPKCIQQVNELQTYPQLPSWFGTDIATHTHDLERPPTDPQPHRGRHLRVSLSALSGGRVAHNERVLQTLQNQ